MPLAVLAALVRHPRRLLLLALTALALIAAALVACGDDEPDQLTMSYMGGFRPQANLPFVAVYVAEDQGFFADEGLTVEISHAATGEHKALILSGEIDITTLPASEMMQLRADSDAPLVAVMLFGQRGDFGYVVLEASGIESPADFAGRLVGFKGQVQAEFLAMIHAHGLTTDDLELVSTGYNPVVVAEGAIDVYPVFLSNEPDTLTRVIGVPIRVFEAADYGVPTLGVVYLVTEEFLEQEGNRDRVERFLRATLRAFQFALDDPAAAIESTRKFIPEEADLEHERFILDTELANAVSPLTDQNGLGWFTAEQFGALQDVLLEYDAMQNAIDLDTALDRSFLERIHSE